MTSEPLGLASERTEWTPYGRRRSEVLGAVPSQEPPPTYYGLPAVKSSHYGWLIATYFFVGGLAGAAQLIAQIADLVGGRRDLAVVRTGRYLALAGALISPALLIADLHMPSRWYNMLRMFRPTSPMSIGSWALTAFGTLTGLVALGQAAEDLTGARLGHGMARFFGLPAALLGAVMATYTGTLLATTSTPLWAVAYRHLPALFGATAMATATAALSLILGIVGAPRSTHRRLDRLALAASAAQLALSLSTEREWKRQGVAAPLEQPRFALARLGIFGLGIVLPLLVHALHLLAGRRSASLAAIAAVATLVGGYVERAVVIFAGNESGRRPEDYFRITQPRR